tara:strand:- start:77174 stop:77809 length:636 start_codon:yes stop_codon:yes gene_type:complete
LNKKNQKLSRSIFLAIILAIVVLFIVILPTEYGIDPTGLGEKIGLNDLNNIDTVSIQIPDVIGSNLDTDTIEIPSPGEPIPLPNPNVYQEGLAIPKSEIYEINMGPFEASEFKAIMRSDQMIIFSWQASDQGLVYSDFHGHGPDWPSSSFVRYQEHGTIEGINNTQGSLVASFDGEHGWFWLNLNDYPITITLKLDGYYDDTIDYGILPGY